MWKKYANSRRGFCIGYDVKCWLNTNMTIGGGEVMYVSKLPKIHPNEDTTINYMRQIYTKEDKWDFEQEFRLHKNWFKHVTSKERQISVPAICVKEIIFGADMPEKHKKEIRSIAKKKFPNVRFIKMNRNKKKYEKAPFKASRGYYKGSVQLFSSGVQKKIKILPNLN